MDEINKAESPEASRNDTISSGREGQLWEAFVPILLFIGVNRFAGLIWAIVAATAWSLIIASKRFRNGHPVGRFLPLVTAGIIARGAVGVLTDSEAVYFGIGIGIKASIGLALIVSVLINKNVLATYTPRLFGLDTKIANSPVYQSAMNHIAFVVAFAEFASAAFDIWLFNNASVDGYLIIRFFVNWPFTTAVIIVSFLYLNRRLGKLPDFPGLAALLEERLDRIESEKKSRKKPKKD